MQALVIPDVHLKPWMFDRASAIMKEHGIDRAVCLMDLADDWGKQFQTELYEQTYAAAADFAKEWPKTKWCYGNHDMSYVWGRLESGYSPYAERTVKEGLAKLKAAVANDLNLAFVHRIDNVLFSHGGVLHDFVKEQLGRRMGNTDYVIDAINSFDARILWKYDSPLWARPQYEKKRLYREKTMLQVVGHTCVESIRQEGNLISCDVFSAHPDGTPAGSQEFLLLDTATWEWEGVK